MVSRLRIPSVALLLFTPAGGINDSDYIQSSQNPSTDICRVRISDPPVGVAPPVRVRYRYKREGAGTVNLIVRLKQDTTVIASWTHNSIADSFVTASQTLSTDEFNAVTNFASLFLEFEANAA